MKILYSTMFVLLVSLLVVPAGMAQERGSLELTSTILREVEVKNEKGEVTTELVTVEKAMPGEELIVRVSYTNQGSEPAENLVIVNPVPDEMFYVAGSASGESVTAAFSIDGGKSFNVPEKLLVTDEEGKLNEAPPKAYTHVRFSRSRALNPGETGEVSFRAVLE